MNPEKNKCLIMVNGGVYRARAASISANGELVLVSEPLRPDLIKLFTDDENGAYDGFPYILLEKEDATNIYQYLKDQVLQFVDKEDTEGKEPTELIECVDGYTKEVNSMFKLEDAIDGVIYPIKSFKVD